MKTIAYLAFFAAGVGAGAAVTSGLWVRWVAAVAFAALGLLAAELDRCKPDPRDPIA